MIPPTTACINPTCHARLKRCTNGLEDIRNFVLALSIGTREDLNKSEQRLETLKVLQQFYDVNGRHPSDAELINIGEHSYIRRYIIAKLFM